MSKPILIIIDGLNGAGKTTVAHLLHSKMNRTVLLSFDKFKRLISDFSPNEEYHALTNHILRAMTKEYFKHNINVIIESYIPTKEISKRYTSLANKGIKLYYYQLEAPMAIRMERIQNRPLAKDARKHMTKKHLLKNDTIYLKNKFNEAKTIKTEDKSPQQIVKIILQNINN